jgi:hypothetical protein
MRMSATSPVLSEYSKIVQFCTVERIGLALRLRTFQEILIEARCLKWGLSVVAQSGGTVRKSILRRLRRQIIPISERLTMVANLQLIRRDEA